MRVAYLAQQAVAPLSTAVLLCVMGCSTRSLDYLQASTGSAGAAGDARDGGRGAAGNQSDGGATGGGSGSQAGSGGSGSDPELPVLECGGTRCPDENVLVDMEANDGRVCATRGRSGNASVFNDGTGEQWPEREPLGLGKFSPLPTCRGQSAVALHTKGEGFTSWGAGAAIRFSEHGWDASAYAGLTFWAMSPTNTRIAFGIASAETQDVAYGGACVPRDGKQCADHFTTSRTLTAAWMAYTITFAELRQAGFGVPAPSGTINPATLMELNIVFPPGAPFDVWIDDVVFTQ